MKIKSRLLPVTLLLVFLFVSGYALLGHKLTQHRDGLALKVQTDKDSYMPGEIVSLHFSITNESGTPALLSRQSTVWDGNLKVYVSSAGGPFREYFGPGWGTRDTVPGEPVKLLPGQAFETEATLLWNQQLQTSHLNEVYRKKLDKERLTTDYALPAAGQYYVKAILFFPNWHSD
jgi:hypothetical protein